MECPKGGGYTAGDREGGSGGGRTRRKSFKRRINMSIAKELLPAHTMELFRIFFSSISGTFFSAMHAPSLGCHCRVNYIYIHFNCNILHYILATEREGTVTLFILKTLLSSRISRRYVMDAYGILKATRKRMGDGTKAMIGFSFLSYAYTT